MLSYWEKQSLLQYDYIIAGSGIVGLSTAISLKDKLPAARVLVLESDILPTGASTKNAGFACIGSLTELLSDFSNMPREEVLGLLQMRRNGLQLLRRRIGDEAMQYREAGSYELIGMQEEHALAQLDSVNNVLRPLLGGDAFTLASDKIDGFGFNKDFVRALIRNNYEGELHTGRMMRSLIDIAIARGVEIKTGCRVSHLEDLHTGVRVTVPTAEGEEVGFMARRVAVCTNAFARQLLPELDLQPGRGQVLLTNVIPGLRFKGVFHMDEGYYYFRELDGRVLFGGGRNLDFEKETTTSFDLNPEIQQQLENRLHNIILPGQSFMITDRWTGIMAFGRTRQPLIRYHTHNIVLGVRMGGMGVAIGSAVGEQLSAFLTE
ncbi:NAD(P)/FAD-dependent oxidoreductase [Chitinophaga ginsengisoli]|uniref:Glycine/D-amino acid oxidase-like deaminating enzyme n=1 Tax=Chitinophaga ginsengisoli TaxID=363837 RepID=A0A2P8G7F3_9BACT|nr:FAD-dependent oxidoreductase [Chitinophaga ginsengisoli]PSL29908.1 glycine/D-amino acid oxidase-like deaminating enzyme [Chitinophaga ginsengisoli]